MDIETTLGRYHITAKLGQGGMGEVWRATDTELGREVALKLLPDGFADDPERHARFEREAKLLASLNAPNIATLYGLEHLEDRHILVMELVEGEGLDDAIARGPIPLSEAIAIARQIAEALESAHEHGIVHRDLKPGNIRIRADGTVKVLDFGLAKSWQGADDISGLSLSPTMTANATAAGVILGTAAYMSPEQARGKAVDRRADIWSFGVVVWEMLTGRSLFASETVSDTLAAVLTREPDWRELPAGTLSEAKKLLRRCLEPNPKLRLRDIGEARILLDRIASGEIEDEAAPTEMGRRGWIGLVGVAVLTVLASWLAFHRSPPPPASPEITEFLQDVPGARVLSFSPDGRRLAWSTPDSVMVRDLGEVAPRTLLKSEAGTVGELAWSPDGSELAVEVGERLERVPLDGGKTVSIGPLPRPEGVPRAEAISLDWRADGRILIASWRGGIYSIPAAGGDPRIEVPIDPEKDIDFHMVQAFEAENALLVSIHHQNVGGRPTEQWGVEWIKGGVRSEVPTPGLSGFRLVGYACGSLVFNSGSSADPTIWRVPFDPATAEITGERTIFLSGAGGISLGQDGSLVYMSVANEPRTVVRVDRSGNELETIGPSAPGLRLPTLSPDGGRLACALDATELTVLDLERGTQTLLQSLESGINSIQWSADGRALYYTYADSEGLWRIPTVPGARPEIVLEQARVPALAFDGSGILTMTSSFRLDEDRQGLFWFPLDKDGRVGEVRKVLSSFGAAGRLSPDGRAIAYSFEDKDRRELYLATFPEMDQAIQLSTGGGRDPNWSPDGRSIVFRTNEGLAQVDIGRNGTGQLTASPVRPLFDPAKKGYRIWLGWEVPRDGRGLLLVRAPEDEQRDSVVVRRHALAAAPAG